LNARIITKPVSAAIYLGIFALGFQFACNRTFIGFHPFDDEGSGLLLVQAFLSHPSSYDSLGGFHGPFYFLVEYIIHGLFNVDISHDATRLLTVVLWSLTALAGALYVFRATGSFVLAVIAQLQLIVHLDPLRSSPGHPQAMVLLLIMGALLLSSVMDTRRRSRFSFVGLGMILGALLLTKINIGAFFGIALALGILVCLPRSVFVRGLLVAASSAALLVPAAITLPHLFVSPSTQGFCIVVTLVIAACLIASSRERKNVIFDWFEVRISLVATLVTVGCVAGFIMILGGTARGILDSVLLRPLNLSDLFFVSINISPWMVHASIASVLLALCYRFTPLDVGGENTSTLLWSVCKLAYGVIAFYRAYAYGGPPDLLYILPIPFLWVVLIDSGGGNRAGVSDRFPRVFLCFLAAFETLQAYPVAGVQVAWASILVIPVALVCIADSIPVIWGYARRRWPRVEGWHIQPWHQFSLSLLVIGLATVVYYEYSPLRYGRISNAESESLGLPGASRIYLGAERAEGIRKLVKDLRAQCDGFIGLPGAPSFHIWTGIPSPAIVKGYWTVSMSEQKQHAVIDIMESYRRPCAIYNPRAEKLWQGDQPPPGYADKPLVKFIRANFVEVERYNAYRLLKRIDGNPPALQGEPAPLSG